MNNNLGQIFTKKNIVNLMISLFNGNKNSRILEPSYGEGIFLNILQEQNFNNITGIEFDKNLFIKNKFSNINCINTDYLTFSDKNKFDLIIGNPPYVKNNNIIQSVKNNILNDISNNEWDLYYHFIYHSINLLKENGELIFITPITFLTNTYANTLRNFIYEQGYISDIIEFNEQKIFEKADIEVIIFKFIKYTGNKKDKINLYKAKDNKIYKKEKIYLSDFYKKEITHFSKKDFFWNIYKSNKIYNYNKKITDIFDVYVGMVSGKDNAFLLSEEEYKKLNKEEKNIIKTFIKAKNIKNDIFNKYIFIEKGYIKTEEELKNKFYGIYKVLKPLKKDLSERYKSKNTKWWEWATIRNLDLMKQYKEKYFIPTITRAKTQNFGFNNKGYYGSGDVCLLSLKQDLTIAEKEKYKGIINSSEYLSYINDIVPKKGNRKLFTHKFLSSLKI